MIKGNFTIVIELPGLKNGKDQLEVKGEFNVNSREELMAYLSEGVDAIEEGGRAIQGI